ncbi:MAG: hypothetical protein LBC70_05255 [Chitinispirillales bacterium]|nr:hypothetical protein [Chitinispirillales bacterium]
MIKINLAKTPALSKGGRAPEGGSSGNPALRIILVLLLLCVGGGGAYYYITYLRPAEAEHEPIATALPPPVPRSDATPAERPSSRVRSNMAENVVKEVDDRADRPAENRLNTPYAEMTTEDKINYEVWFARNVFDMVSRNTPEGGIRFRALEIENFQTVYASGAGLSRLMTEEMFTGYRNSPGELMPRPYSHIRDYTEGRYQFVITFKPRFGVNVTGQFQPVDEMVFREGLAQHVRRFGELARASNYRMPAALNQVSAERVGEYRRVLFRGTGTTSYGDFHKFLVALYDARIPSAFKKIVIRPIRDDVVTADIEVLFTVRD